MTKSFIEFKILSDPFEEKGPILIGDPIFSSVGLKVQFLPNEQESWLANLRLGGTTLSGLWYLDFPNVLIVAGGAAYIIDVKKKKITTKLGYGNYVKATQNIDGTVILADSTNLTMITSDADYWKSEQISIDGFADIESDADNIRGMSWSPTTIPGRWIPFVLNLKTKEISGGSYQDFRDRKTSLE